MLYQLLPASSRFIVLICAIIIFSNSTFGQCTTNFNVEYRAVNKLTSAVGTQFRFDDWNNDGRRDYWYLRYDSPSLSFRPIVYPSIATGYWDWSNPVDLAANMPSGTSYVVKDFDGDGFTDLFLDRVYRNVGGTSMTPLSPPVPTQSFPTMITIGFYDLDNDGKLDWLYGGRNASGTTATLRYQPWTSDGTFGTAVTIYEAPSIEIAAANIAFVDITGDARKDLFVHFSDSAGGAFRVLTNNGNGTFTVGSPAIHDAYFNGVVKDMNNDGRADFITFFQGKLVVLYGQTNGSFTRVEYPSIAYNIVSPPVADLNADGFADILVFTNLVVGVGYGGYNTIINNGGTSFTSVSYQRKYRGLSFADFALEDVNNDGRADLFPNGASAGWSAPLNVNAFGESVLAVFENQCQKKPTMADSFADDNNADIVTWNSSNGIWSWRNWSPGSSLSGLQWGSMGDIPSPGDFDGDGRLDPTVYRNSTATWYSFLSATNSWYVIKFGLTGDIPAPNDYDGDGWTDIAVYRPTDGSWHFWYSRTQTYSGLYFGLTEDKPVPADFDGDGRTDVAVYRPSQGVWYIFQSSNQNVRIQPYGLNTDIPIPADYDGDGKADLAVYRGGTWYIYRSETNSTSILFYGLSTDVPIPFYRTGLSSDIVVHRPSDTKWYNRSIQNQDLPIMGGPNTMPVKTGLPNN